MGLLNNGCILLIGAPGSGKGTIGRAVSLNLNSYLHFAIGDSFRSLDVNSPEGKMHQDYCNRGVLLPDDFTFSLLRRKLNQIEKNQNCAGKILLLDGFPRTVSQLEMLLSTSFIKHSIILFCSEDILIERCLKRAKRNDLRQAELSEDIVRNRIEEYKKQTVPVISSLLPSSCSYFDTSKELHSVLEEVFYLLGALQC